MAQRRTEPQRLATADEIAQAIIWRLKGLDRAKKADLIGRLGQLPKWLRADDPAVAAFLNEIEQAFPGDRRSSWTLACAMVAVTDRMNRGYAFWTAGMVVLGAHRKSLQRAGKGPCDALTDLVAEFLGNHPQAAPLEIWESFTVVALFHTDVLADYDEENNILSFYPDTKDLNNWQDIDYETFARRVRRVRKMIPNHGNPDSTLADVRVASCLHEKAEYAESISE